MHFIHRQQRDFYSIEISYRIKPISIEQFFQLHQHQVMPVDDKTETQIGHLEDKRCVGKDISPNFVVKKFAISRLTNCERSTYKYASAEQRRAQQHDDSLNGVNDNGNEKRLQRFVVETSSNSDMGSQIVSSTEFLRTSRVDRFGQSEMLRDSTEESSNTSNAQHLD